MMKLRWLHALQGVSCGTTVLEDAVGNHRPEVVSSQLLEPSLSLNVEAIPQPQLYRRCPDGWKRLKLSKLVSTTRT